MLHADGTMEQNPPIDGLPNVSTHPQDFNRRWDIFADFLIWQASEQTSSLWATVFTSTSEPTTFEAKQPAFDWDFGFRVGTGYHFDHDQWDTQIYWTWYRTKAHQKIEEANHIVTSEFFAGFANGFIDHDLGIAANLDWTIQYNMFDWELGRSYQVSKALCFRPFIGLKGGWIHQHIHTHFTNVVLLPFRIFSSKEKLKNDFWGVGPSGGIETEWKWGHYGAHSLTLFNTLSTAMMWGTWKCTDVYHNTDPRKINVHMKNSTLGSLMLDGKMGIGWNVDIHGGKQRFSTRVGYEMQIWFNQLRLPTFQQLRLHGNLTLQGGTVDFRFDF